MSKPVETIEVPESWDTPIQRPSYAAVRFTAYSWAKFNYLRDLDDAEVSCFGITDEDDTLLVRDLWVPKQSVSVATVDIDDEGFAEAVERMGRNAPPHTFTRIWLHTHPGDSAMPSSTDRKTQTTTFSTMDWHVMGILAQGGQTHAEMSWWGPHGKSRLTSIIPFEIDWHEPFPAADPDHWSAEYAENVTRSKSAIGFNWPANKPMTKSNKKDRDDFVEFAKRERGYSLDDTTPGHLDYAAYWDSDCDKWIL